MTDEKTNTVCLHRVLPAPPERVYKAFLDPDALVKWNPPHGYTARVHGLDARVGGSFRMSFTNFGAGETHSFGGKYVELDPPHRIRYTDAFDDPALAGTMQTTVELRPCLIGTEITVTQEGLPEGMPLEFPHRGWHESLQLLEQLVTPDIPAGTGPAPDEA